MMYEKITQKNKKKISSKNQSPKTVKKNMPLQGVHVIIATTPFRSMTQHRVLMFCSATNK